MFGKDEVLSVPGDVLPDSDELVFTAGMFVYGMIASCSNSTNSFEKYRG